MVRSAFDGCQDQKPTRATGSAGVGLGEDTRGECLLGRPWTGGALRDARCLTQRARRHEDGKEEADGTKRVRP